MSKYRNVKTVQAITKAMGDLPYAINQLMSCVPFKGKPKPEAAICLSFAETMRRHTLSGRFKGLWHSIPNEGKRGRTMAALLRAMGLIPGTPDYLLTWRDADDRLQVCYIEFKAKGGKESPNQTFFATWCASLKVSRLLCHASDEALAALDALGAFPQK